MISSKAGKRLALSPSKRVALRLLQKKSASALRGFAPSHRWIVVAGIGCVSVAASARMIHDRHVQQQAYSALKPYVAPSVLVAAQAPAPVRSHHFNPLRGIASWYGSVLHGHTTASGEVFDETQMTAAHNTLPLGTRVRVTDVNSRKSVVVRINDRGQLSPGRIIDLSSAAAERLGILRSGVASVRVEVLKNTTDQDQQD